MSYGTSDWIRHGRQYERELEGQLHELHGRRQALVSDRKACAAQADQARKDLAFLLLPELLPDAVAEAVRRSGCHAVATLCEDAGAKREQLTARNAEIEADPVYVERDALRNPDYGTLTVKLAERVADREPLLPFWKAAQHERLPRLLDVNYGFDRYDVAWWRLSYYSDWKAGDEVIEQLEAIGEPFETFAAFRKKYEPLHEAKRMLDGEIDALHNEIRAGEALEQERLDNIAAYEQVPTAFLQHGRDTLDAFLANTEPSMLAGRLDGAPDLELLAKRWAGLQKKAGYLHDLEKHYLDEKEAQYSRELGKLRRKMIKYARPKRRYETFSEAEFRRQFYDRSHKYEKHWKRFDKRAQAVRSFDRYDRGSLLADVLWWDVMTDGKLDGSFSPDVRAFCDAHPTYRYERAERDDDERTDDAFAGAAVADADGAFVDSFYDAS